MTSGIEQAQPGTADANPGQYETMLHIRTLEQQHDAAVKRMVNLEEVLANTQHAVNASSGSERQRLVRELGAVQTDLADTRRQVADVRREIGELTATQPAQGLPTAGPVPVEAPPGFLAVQPAERVFGLTRFEFTAVSSFALLFPLVVALAIRLVRRGTKMREPITGETDSRFSRLEQAVESVAIEVERIGESQRFVAKVLTDRQSSPQRVEARPAAPSRNVATPIP